MDAKKTGILIAALRREKGLSQKELAHRLGVTNKAISRWETGRGYPDIEILPQLCRELGISVRELLEGEVTPEAKEGELVSRNVELVCRYAAHEKQRKNRIIAALVALIALAGFVLIGSYAVYRVRGFAQFIIGQESCVISRDYSSLVYYDQKYVPLPMDGYDCQTGRVIVQEAQVEGSGFLGKLFFGETLYEVLGVPNNEIVYLQTEYDYTVSRYYVLESEYEKYRRIQSSGTYEDYFYVIVQPDGYYKELPLDDNGVEAIRMAQVSTPEENVNRQNSLTVFRYEENHIFYRWEGELVKTDTQYYWSPNDVFSYTGGYYYTTCLAIPEAYSDGLDALFEYALRYQRG